jgi:hypothetical protein
MRKSRTSAFGAILWVAGVAGLIGSLAMRARAYTTCVEQVPCVVSPPPGMYCNMVYPDDGSQAQTGGIAASEATCAYVYDSNNGGTGCGACIPMDPSSTACD